MDGILYSDTTSASAPIECSSTSSSAPSCEVVISGLTSGYEAHITIDVVNTDFSSSDEYISSVLAGSHSLGSTFLESGGEDGNCGKKTRILDAVQVPGSAIAGGQMTVSISTSSDVGDFTCSGKTLDAEVTVQQTVPATTCTDCEAGKYGPGIGSTICTDCAAGKYSASSSATSCTDCEAGKTSVATATAAVATMTCGGSCGDGCSPSPGAQSGTFSDGSGSYGNNEDCWWLIEAPLGTEISVSFSSFNTESGFDYVSVYQCNTAACGSSERTGLLKHSGSSLSSSNMYRSSTGILKVTFTSESGTSAIGFSGIWISSSTSGATSCSTVPNKKVIHMVAVLSYTYSEFTSGSRQNDFRHAVADTAGSVRDKVTINHVRSTSTHRRQASRSGIEVDFTVIDALVETLDIEDLNRNLRLRGLREVSDLKPASTTKVADKASDETCIEGNIVNICILVFPLGLMYLGVVSRTWAPKKREPSVPNVVAGQTAPHLAPVPVSRDMLERVDNPLQLGCPPPATPADPAAVVSLQQVRVDEKTGKCVKFNRGPQGKVGIACEKLGSLGARIARLIPDGPAMNCGQLAVGDIIESVDGMPLASLSLDEIGDGLKGQPGSIIALYIHARGAHAETDSQTDTDTLTGAHTSV